MTDSPVRAQDRIYSVQPGNETPDEPLSGVYWWDDEGGVHGPYRSRLDAHDAIEAWTLSPPTDPAQGGKEI